MLKKSRKQMIWELFVELPQKIYKFREKAPIIIIGVVKCGGEIVRINCRLKLVFIIIIAIIVLAIPLAAQVNGKINECKIDKYIAIGDEISLDSRESYDVKHVSLIKEFLYSLNENLEYYNLSEKGINSSDLLNIIENNKEKIRIKPGGCGDGEVCNGVGRRNNE